MIRIISSKKLCELNGRLFELMKQNNHQKQCIGNYANKINKLDTEIKLKTKELQSAYARIGGMSKENNKLRAKIEELNFALIECEKVIANLKNDLKERYTLKELKGTKAKSQTMKLKDSSKQSKIIKAVKDNK